jgi:hypothetical protein
MSVQILQTYWVAYSMFETVWTSSNHSFLAVVKLSEWQRHIFLKLAFDLKFMTLSYSNSTHCNQGTSWSLSCAAVLAAVLFARQGQHTFKLFQSLTLILSRTYTHTYANKVEMTYFSWWLIYEISIWYQTIEYYDAHVTCRGAWLSHSANLSRQQAVSVSFLFISPDFSCQQ